MTLSRIPIGGPSMLDLARRLYPIPRSLTGNGVRETLRILAEGLPDDAPLQIREVPSGTSVFDWTVPDEWNVREAWIKGPSGEKVVDFADHRLHLLGYSEPVDRVLSLAELQKHLFTLPDRPELIPYRTSYYRRAWGFCLPHHQLEALPEGDYEVKIDGTLEPGHLTYGEIEIPATVPGGGDGDVLLSTHVCHPQLANDNLSGLVVMRELACRLAALPERRYGYRFLFVPGTLGAVVWLATRPEAAARVAHGLVAANLGGDGAFHYKRSFAGTNRIDRAVERVLTDAEAEDDAPFEIEEFSPFGYDERQYNSPGFRLPVGSLTRTPWGRYPEYHTSADDLSLLTEDGLEESLDRYLQVVTVLEADRCYVNLSPHGEPQLGKRGLYSHIGGGDDGRRRQLALLWVLNLSDGDHSLLDVAERSGFPFREIAEAARALEAAHLLAPARGSTPEEETR